MADNHLFKKLGLLHIFFFFLRSDNLASVIRGDPHAFQRFGHLALQFIRTNILGKDLNQMLHVDVSTEMQIVLFKGKVDMFSQIRIFFEMCNGEKHVLVAGAARRDNIQTGLFGNCQIAGAECVCQ